jgi:hypothetical protein
MLTVEVRTMTGIGIPPFDPATVGNATESSIWPGIVAAVVLAVVFGAAIWTYLRTRPARVEPHAPEVELPRVA